MYALKSGGKNRKPINYFKTRNNEIKDNNIHTFRASNLIRVLFNYKKIPIQMRVNWTKEKEIQIGVLLQSMPFFLISRAMNSFLKNESSKLMPVHETQPLQTIEA